MTATEHARRFTVRRSLSYCHTFYGSTDDLAEARSSAKSHRALGYPCEILDTSTPCGSCDGSGRDPSNDSWTCRACSGSGFLRVAVEELEASR